MIESPEHKQVDQDDQDEPGANEQRSVNEREASPDRETATACGTTAKGRSGLADGRVVARGGQRYDSPRERVQRARFVAARTGWAAGGRLGGVQRSWVRDTAAECRRVRVYVHWR